MRDIALTMAEGRIRASINPIAASIRSLRVDDVDLVQTYAGSTPPLMAGGVLVPWPNRIDRGRWLLNGSVQQLAITEPDRDTALHGLLARSEYDVVMRVPNAVTLAADIVCPPGYPFLLHTEVTFSLGLSGVTVTHRIKNDSSEQAPVALGVHPYLRVGDADALELSVRIPARTRYMLDERYLPTGRVPVDGPFDLRRPVRVDEAIDHAGYTDLLRRGDRVELALIAPDGRGVVIWADERFTVAQLYRTSEFPSPDGRLISAIALEPMTAPPNSLASGEGLTWLSPNETWSARWGIEYRPAP